TLRIWDVKDEALIGEPFVRHEGWVWSVAVSPDDRRIASGEADNTVNVVIRDAKTGVILSTLEGHHNSVQSVTFM
ncbi:hypothetical protein BDR05DRAFT_895018, partial [Suillus weaverae]